MPFFARSHYLEVRDRASDEFALASAAVALRDARLLRFNAFKVPLAKRALVRALETVAATARGG